jgi:hypothetical protein
MRRVSAVAGSVCFLLLAPGTVAGLVPWWISGWRVQAPLLGFFPFRWLGALLIVAGLPVLLDSFARFALKGLGTPAPVFPTRHLVVSGLYRYVRNPMYLAVAAVIFGQGFWFRNLRVGVWSSGLRGFPPVCFALRGAGVAAELRDGVCKLLRSRFALGSAVWEVLAKLEFLCCRTGEATRACIFSA